MTCLRRRLPYANGFPHGLEIRDLGGGHTSAISNKKTAEVSASAFAFTS